MTILKVQRLDVSLGAFIEDCDPTALLQYHISKRGDIVLLTFKPIADLMDHENHAMRIETLRESTLWPVTFDSPIEEINKYTGRTSLEDLVEHNTTQTICPSCVSLRNAFSASVMYTTFSESGVLSMFDTTRLARA